MHPLLSPIPRACLFASLFFPVPPLLPQETGSSIPLEVRAGSGDSRWKRADFLLDHRYSPPWWVTAICLPDDWHKGLVGRRGELLQDRGRGFHFASTWFTFQVPGAGGPLPSRQFLENPRIPLVHTSLAWKGGARLDLTTFTVVPGSPLLEPLPPPPVPAIPVAGRPGTLAGWAHPGPDTPPCFRRVHVGWGGRVLAYKIPVNTNGSCLVAAGLCEGYHKNPGIRPLLLEVEGGKRTKVDPVADAGPDEPLVRLLEGKDADGDGFVLFRVSPVPGARDANTILNALWAFPPGSRPDLTALVQGKDPGVKPIAFLDCGLQDDRDKPPRMDLWSGILHGASRMEVDLHSSRPLTWDPGKNTVLLDGSPFLVPYPAPARVDKTKDGLALSFSFPGEGAHSFCIARPAAARPIPVPPAAARAEAERALSWWKKRGLPWGRILVPDRAVQGLLDACIRNIWQAREIEEGRPAFQVGPLVYRGLWIVDGAFLLEAVTYLGRWREARAGIEHILTFQRGDGGFQLLRKYWKETGIVLWILKRHFELTGDKAWIESLWPRVRRMVAFIHGLRLKAEGRCEGLLPPGFTDGGIGGIEPEYSNVYWTMVGLESARDMARALGKGEDARAFGEEADSLRRALEKAAARDGKETADGLVLPVVMPGGRKYSDVRGQWAFLHGVFPGRLWPADHPLVRGIMAALEKSKREGIIYGSGWNARGVWNYLASFYGHALLWLGRDLEAEKVLYAFANHSSPTLAWREEQSLRGDPPRETGDMPHNWASAEFIRFVRHLLVLERGRELHLLEGIPPTWLSPGARTALTGVPTTFGPVGLDLQVAPSGKKARLTLTLSPSRPPGKVVLHLGTGTFQVLAGRLPGRIVLETELQE